MPLLAMPEHQFAFTYGLKEDSPNLLDFGESDLYHAVEALAPWLRPMIRDRFNTDCLRYGLIPATIPLRREDVLRLCDVLRRVEDPEQSPYLGQARDRLLALLERGLADEGMAITMSGGEGDYMLADKDPEDMIKLSVSFAARGVLTAGLAIVACAACTPGEPPTASPSRPPIMVDSQDPEPDGPPGFGGPDIVERVFQLPSRPEVVQMFEDIRANKPGGCDKPVIPEGGGCESLGTCDTYPFSGSTATANVKLFLSFTAPSNPPPDAAIDIELFKCGAPHSPVMKRTQPLFAYSPPMGEITFSVPTEPNEKYFFRFSHKLPDTRIIALYELKPGGG